MPTRLRRGMRHARRGFFYPLVIGVILMAIAVAIADRLLPLVQQHPDKIAAWLIERAGRPVHFDRAEAHWTNRGPVFTLNHLRIGEGKQQLAVDHAELLVAMYGGFLPDHPFTELRLRGLALTVERDASGQWHFVGLSGPNENENHDPLQNLEGLGELQVTDATLTVRAPSQGIVFTTPRVDVRMRVSEKRLRAGIRVNAMHGSPLLAVLDFDRTNNGGKLWIGATDLDLAPWSPVLDYAAIGVAAGHGKVGLWGTMLDRRVVSVQADANLHGLVFRSRTLDGATTGIVPEDSRLADLQLLGRWEKVARGWRAQATRLRLHNASGDESLDGITMRDAGDIAIVGEHIDVGDLLSIAMLSNRVSPALRHWLSQAAPDMRFSNAQLMVTHDGRVRGSATLDEAGWKPVGSIPALQGIGGSLRFDNDAIAIEFAPHPLQIVWPPALGEPLPMQIDGTVVAWRDGTTWTVESSNLHSHNNDIDLQTSFAMRFKNDGTRPRLDLATVIGPIHMVAARRYWIRHKMSAKTIAWLDMAIQGGELLGGHALVSGDLDDWSFKHNEGKFQASAQIDDAQLHFDPEWPTAEHVGGHLVFEGDGMQFDGSGTIAGLQAKRISVGIPDFHAPILDVQADASGSGAQMLGLVRRSPLQKRYADTFNALDVQGNGQTATMHLVLPLHEGLGERSVQGDVDFKQARLYDKRWDLLLTDTTGRLHYDQNGVLADALAVKLDGDPATFHLGVGGAASGAANIVSAQLRGTFPAATLLKHAPSLDWLKPVIAGRAAWTVDVQVPKSVEGAKALPAQLDVRSDLFGATLKLPAPLNKPANQPLALAVHALLPADAGDIVVKLGNVLSVRGRYTGSQPFRGLLVFGGDASGALPASGLVANGRMSELDAAGWIGFAANGQGGAGGLQTVDLQADNLLLGGRQFANAHVRMARTTDATTVRLDSDALAGSVMVPTPIAQGIRGQFDRLYWPGALKSPAGTVLADADTDVDPATVPPLHLDVADLRFGDAKLGKLTLQTRPIANGLRIEQLDAIAASQSVSATGDWTRQGPRATKTHLSIDFRADSLGKMLDAFGFKGVVAAGKTHAVMQGGWPGSPAAFRMAVMNGTLSLDVGAGRLLEVKPGAGRILGLVSLAELPRRLSLDFRDFFDKGFSFNSLRGHFVFANGQASTKDLSIKGPAADIFVSGSADLVAQRYDQTIEVLPKASGVVTAVGAIAGGPIGAAVGAVAGAVLRGPLQHIARKRYHVTGTWADPVVQVLHGEEG